MPYPTPSGGVVSSSMSWSTRYIEAGTWDGYAITLFDYTPGTLLVEGSWATSLHTNVQQPYKLLASAHGDLAIRSVLWEISSEHPRDRHQVWSQSWWEWRFDSVIVDGSPLTYQGVGQTDGNGILRGGLRYDGPLVISPYVSVELRVHIDGVVRLKTPVAVRFSVGYGGVLQTP